MTKKKLDPAALELLMGIKGVGEVTAIKLLKKFKRVDNVSKATDEALQNAGLNSHTAKAVLAWAKTQDKQRRKPVSPRAQTVPQPQAVLESPKVTPKAETEDKHAPPPAPQTAAGLPIPVPFGNPKDVRVRTTPPPEIVDMESLRNGGPLKTTPMRQTAPGQLDPGAKKAIAANAKKRVPAPKAAQPKPAKPFVFDAPKPGKIPPGLEGPYRIVGQNAWGCADRNSRKGGLVAVFTPEGKALGYGQIRYNGLRIVEPK